MNPFKVKVTASLAGVIFASSSLMVVGAKATQVGGVDTDFLSSDYGQATLVKGVVSKSQPTDAARTAYGEFVEVKNTDKLPEGTLVKTGDRSSISIDWMVNAKKVGITRLWQNSLATVSTKTRLVHLQKGELFHNKGTDRADHILETKLLQARIHGTTVHLKVTQEGDKEIARIYVLETQSPKPVEVVNRLNGSRVNLRPGIVLEIRGTLTQSPIVPPLQPGPNVSSDRKELNMCLKPDKGELIFQDSKTQTIAYVANSKAVLEHPAVKGGDGIKPLDSIDLIRRDMSKIPSSDDILGNMFDAALNIGKPDKLITKNLSIGCVPTKTKYYVGPNVGQGMGIELPSLAFSDFHPAGRIAPSEVVNTLTASAPSHTVATHSPVQTMIPHQINGLAAPAEIESPLPEMLTNRFTEKSNIQPILQGQVQQQIRQFQNVAQQPVQIPVQTIQQFQTQMPVQTQIPVPIAPMPAPQMFQQQQPIVPFQSQQNLSIVPFNSQGAAPIGSFSKADNLQGNLQNLGKAN